MSDIDPIERKLPLPDQEAKHKRMRKDKSSRDFGMEYRMRPHLPSFNKFGWADWRKSWKWFRTERERDEAMSNLNRKDTLFEWRPITRNSVIR